jgi:putative DNA primase/helicase
MTPFQRVCTALERVTRTVRYSSDGRQAQAHCPGPTHSHGDRNPSLSVSLGDDGRALLQCFTGCATEAIVATLGLKMADLFPDRPPSRIVSEYSYRDESGAVLYQNVRYEPKTFRMRRPGDGDGGQWVWDTKGVRRVLYRLPELRDQRRVVLVEGEKDADRLWSLSIPATTTVGGANSWRSEYAEQLQSAGVQEVVILPDNDDPGRRYAAQAEGALREGQIAVATLEFSDLPEGGDVSDWLDAGGDPEQLRAAIAAAPTRRLSDHDERHDDEHDDHDTDTLKQEALDLIAKADGLEPAQRVD